MAGAQSIIGYASTGPPLTTYTQMTVLRGARLVRETTQNTCAPALSWTSSPGPLWSCLIHAIIWSSTCTQLVCDDYPNPFQCSHQLSIASWMFHTNHKTGVSRYRRGCERNRHNGIMLSIRTSIQYILSANNVAIYLMQDAFRTTARHCQHLIPFHNR